MLSNLIFNVLVDNPWGDYSIGYFLNRGVYAYNPLCKLLENKNLKGKIIVG